MNRSATSSNAEVLRDRQFGPYFAGNLLSNSGTWFHNIAAAAAIYLATGSSLLVGLVSVLQFVGVIVLAPFAGTLTDRVDRRRLLLATQVVSFAAAATLAAGATRIDVTADEGGVALILGATAVMGAAHGLAMPAMGALVVNLVRDEHLETAVALSSVTFHVARALGPVAGGVTFTTFGAVAAFGVNAVSFLPLIVALLMVRPRTIVAQPTSRRGFVAALQFVRRDRVSLVVLLALAAMSFATDPVNTLTPALADRFGQSPAAVGEQVSAFGAGAVLVLIVLNRLSRRFGNARAGVLGIGMVGCGILLVAVSPFYPAALLAFAVAGSGYLLGVSLLTGALHRRLDEDMRGRVMALWSVAFLGARPVGAVVNGAASDAFGVVVAVTLAAAVALLSLVWLAPRLWRTA
jgi:MFS family permease